AKMLDYSDGGISFASDGLFEKDTLLYFGILYPPDYVTSRVLEYYKGKVMWHKDAKGSPFNYEYGIQLISESSRRESSSIDTTTNKESRNHPRRPFFRPLRFSTQNETYSGSTKNISASGVFIAAKEKLEVGQLLKLNLPLKEGKMARAVGQIMWENHEGFGLKFIEIKN
ncbi:MAG: PilZ domain-containing protein, partial [Desulfobacteraceae bacterium]|nr:PilZ domain-containing protein [Desulfobacteraceae bacterium]